MLTLRGIGVLVCLPVLYVIRRYWALRQYVWELGFRQKMHGWSDV